MKRYSSILLIVTVALSSLLIYGGYLINQEFFYTIDVSLTPEQRQEYELKLNEYSEKLKLPDPNDDLGRPMLDYFIEKARYEEYLGMLSKSMSTLKDALAVYPVAAATVNNLANVYEQMHRYKVSIGYFKTLIRDYQMPQYYMDIARVARLDGDFKLSKDSYWAYQRIFKSPDPEFENWLREEAKKDL